jgi:hypothetical protein
MLVFGTVVVVTAAGPLSSNQTIDSDTDSVINHDTSSTLTSSRPLHVPYLLMRQKRGVTNFVVAVHESRHSATNNASLIMPEIMCLVLHILIKWRESGLLCSSAKIQIQQQQA